MADSNPRTAGTMPSTADARLAGMSTTSPTRPPWVRWLPALLWAAVIFIGSSFPGSAVPGGVSVYGHLGEYAVLGWLVLMAERHRGFRTAALIAIVFAAVYGASDEIHQIFVPMRSADPLDWLADVAGATIAVAAYGAGRIAHRGRVSRRRSS